MRTAEKFFHCGDQLMKTLASAIAEIRTAMTAVPWKEEFSIEHDGRLFSHQTAYNKVFEREFDELGWENQPALRSKPTLKGDFRKGLVFVEIQFGNSATLYRDYYKFQYGLANGLLSLAVLVAPSRPKEFFPTRPRSVANMAEYRLAERYLSLLPFEYQRCLLGCKLGPTSTTFAGRWLAPAVRRLCAQHL